MSGFEVVTIAGIVWIGFMASFAVMHLEKIEKLLNEIRDRRHE